MAFALGIARGTVASTPPLVLVEQARQHYQAAQFQEAVTNWGQAAEGFAVQGDDLNQAMALGNLALSYQSLGQWDEANASLADSLNLLNSQPETPEQQRIFASTLEIQGQGQLAIGQPSAALETWQAAQVIYQNQENLQGVSRSQINQAQALQSLGLYPQACSILLKTLGRDRLSCTVSPSDLQTLTTPSSVPHQILALRSLGNILRVIGNSEQSQQVLIKSWQLAQATEDYPTTAEIYLSLGNTARALGNRQPATPPQQSLPLNVTEDCISSEHPTPTTNYYQQAAACYRQAALSPIPETKIQAQLNQLDLTLQRQQWAEIPVLLPNIQTTLAELASSDTSINAQLKYVRSLTCLKASLDPTSDQQRSPIEQQCHVQETDDPQQAITPPSMALPSGPAIAQIAITAYQQAQAINNPKAQANALGYLANIYQQQKDWTQSQSLTEQALQLLSALNVPEVTYLWQWQLGQLYQRQGNLPEAIAAYTLAYDNLQVLRQDLVSANRDLQFSFRDSVEPVYRELVDLLLQGDHPSQENLKQARDVIESLQIAELNNFFQEACLDTPTQSIDSLDPHAAVVYSIVLPKRLAVILSLPGQPLSYYATPIPSSTVEQTFEDWKADLHPALFRQPSLLRRSQQFYDWLIRPVKSQLEEQDIKTLTFVSDGVLRNIPMAILHDGQQYLVEQYNLALTPGLQLLSPSSFAAEKRNTLAGGLAAARPGLPIVDPLPGVEQEINNISAIVPTTVLLDEEFTRDRLQQSFQTNPTPIVHLATHGQFASQAENTFLLTWDDQINVKDLDQLLENPDPIELLILSACRTAEGDKRATLGMAGIAVRARARSTLATLWAVEDRSTAELMESFYRVFKQPGVTKAEALRQAQLSLLKDAEYQHPYYWSGFVLVGNWL